MKKPSANISLLAIIGVAVVLVMIFQKLPEPVATTRQGSGLTPGNSEASQNMAGAIRKSGYECPSVTRFWDRGITPLGDRIEVLCGPDGSGDAYPDLHYAVYPSKGLVIVCKPYGSTLAACE